MSTYDLTGKINQRLAQYINSTAWQRKQKWAWWESGWSSDVHLLCPPFILFLSLSLFSLLWAVIDLISSALNWSHDSCCSDWPSLTAHRHSSVMPSPIYLSICLCLLSLSLPSGKSTCCPHWVTMAHFAPILLFLSLFVLLSLLLVLCMEILFSIRHLSVNHLKGFNILNLRHEIH